MGCQGVGIEVFLQAGRARAVLIGAGEKINHHFAGSGDLAQASRRRPVAGIGEREIDQFERPVQRRLGPVRIP